MGRPVARAAAVLLAAALSACATSGPPRPVPPSHTLFPGTRVSLALPEGFRHDPAIGAYESPDALTAIFVSELPGSVYSTAPPGPPWTAGRRASTAPARRCAARISSAGSWCSAIRGRAW